MRPLIARPIAHRGLHDAEAGVIENSLAAIEAAAAAGYGVELDVRLTADGEAVVFHDARLDRLTAETGPVRALTAAQLARIALAGDAAEASGIPSLAEALARVGGRAPVIVEIKDETHGFTAAVGALEARVAAVLAPYLAAHGRLAGAAMAFNPHSMIWLRAHAPEIPRGLVARRVADPALPAARNRALAGLADWEAAAPDFVSYEWRALPTPETEDLRAAGRPVLCWTITRAEDAAAVAPYADAITFEGFRP